MQFCDDPFVQRYRSEHPKRDVAIVLLLDEADRILMVRTRRLPNQWQPVGGGVDPEVDTSAVQAAVRELLEETGVQVAPEALTHIADTRYDFGEGIVSTFVTRIPDYREVTIDSDEILDSRWVRVSEALHLPMFPATEASIKTLMKRPDLIRNV